MERTGDDDDVYGSVCASPGHVLSVLDNGAGVDGDGETEAQEESQEVGAGEAQFFAAIARAPRLTRDEERALLVRVAVGDAVAREQVITSNLLLVAYQVRRFVYPQQVTFMDLMQAGTLGLIKAVDNFDVLRGTRLSTYAVPHIRAEIIKYLDSNKSIRVPQAVARRHYRLQETFEELKREEGPLQGASVSEEELAAATGIAPAHVRDWLVCGRRDTLSLDAPITDTGMTLADVIEDEGSSGEQEREYTRMELSNQLGDALGKLTKKELKFVQMRYGADASMSYISKTLKISPKRLKKLEAAVLLKLRETMKNVI